MSDRYRELIKYVKIEIYKRNWMDIKTDYVVMNRNTHNYCVEYLNEMINVKLDNAKQQYIMDIPILIDDNLLDDIVKVVGEM